MKIKNYKVREFIEVLDGSVNNISFQKDLGNNFSLWMRDDNEKFVIKDYNNNTDEYIWVVVK